MVDLTEFQKYLAIDKTELDEDLIQQPTLYAEVALEYAAACDRRDAAKQYADTVYAELIVLGKRAVEKTTELLLRSQAEIDPKYKEAFASYLESKLLAAQIEALVAAFDQRRSMLSRLVDMQVKEYISSDGSSTREVVYSQQRAQLAKSR